METITVVIVDDNSEYSDALKKVLGEQTAFSCEVIVVNPVDKERTHIPTFEEIHDEIAVHTEDSWPFSIVLMDENLGEWKWKGSNLAPSFFNTVSISTEKTVATCQYAFTRKVYLTYPDDSRDRRDAAREEFVSLMVRVLKEKLPKEFAEKL